MKKKVLLRRDDVFLFSFLLLFWHRDESITRERVEEILPEFIQCFEKQQKDKLIKRQ